MSQAFFDRMAPEAAREINQLSRTIFELRESRKRILDTYAMVDENALLSAIEHDRINEHPGYEHYLSARILADAHQDARRQLMPGGRETPPATLHLAFVASVGARFGEHLAEPVTLLQDAMRIVLDNGATLTVRIAAADAFSLEWAYDDRNYRIDTAPRHDTSRTANGDDSESPTHGKPGCAHVHVPGGAVLSDPYGLPLGDAEATLFDFIEKVLADPDPVPDPGDTL